MMDQAPRILIVEDGSSRSDSVRALFVKSLSAAMTTLALDDAAGLQAAQNRPPDLVILCVRTFGGRGLSACLDIGRNTQVGHIPVIVVSRSAHRVADRVRALENGADAYLAGPFEPDELLAQVRTLLRMKRSVDHLRQKHELLSAELARGASELQASEARFKTLFEHSPDPMFVEDEQGVVLDVNEAGCRLHQMTYAQLVGKNVVDLVPESERDEVSALAPGWVSGEERERVGHSYTSDGRSIPVEIKGSPIEYGGRPAALLTVRDSTARRKEIERQVLTMRGLRSIVEIADELIACQDMNALLRRAVELARERLGLERVGILRADGDTVRGTFGVDMHGNVTDERAHSIPMDDVWRERFRLREPHEHRWSFSTETLQDWKNGHMRSRGRGWVAVTPIQTASKAVGVLCNDAAITGAPFDPDKQEVVAVYCSMLANIIERKTAESESRLRATALDQSTEGIFITDLKGVISYVNPAFSRISGYSNAELIGSLTELLGSEGSGSRQAEEIWKGLQEAESWAGRIKNRRKDAKEYDADMLISTIRLPSGEKTGFLVSCRDVTREIEMEQALRQSQKMESIGRLTGGIAHDFNNLLTGILGFARLLKEALGPEHECQPDVEEIIKSGERAARLTRQLLAFGHKQVVKVQTINLNDVVTQIDQLLRRTLGERIELVTHIGSGDLFIEADAGMIEQVLMNLSVNSRDAMPDGGKLVIRTAHVVVSPEMVRGRQEVVPGNYVMLSVSDTGSGISDEVRNHIFEPFFTTKARGAGTGLGLSTVYGVVKHARGFIELESAVGVGTEFRVYFPASTAVSFDDVSRSKAMPRTGHETILLVEDESTVRRLATRDLSGLGYRVLEAGHGDEALTIYEKEGGAVNLVLTDVVMPIMGGVELVRRLRERNPDIRVLYMSGFTEDLQLNGATGGSSAPLILKPFTIEALAAEVRRVLDA